MINKNALVYGVLFFSCAPFMIAHAKYGEEIPFKISAYIESESCDMVVDAEDDITIQLPDMGIDQVESFYKNNSDKVYNLPLAKNVKFRCATGKSAKFSIFSANSCEASTVGWGGCLANNPSLGYRLHFNFQDANNVKTYKDSSDNAGSNNAVHSILLDASNFANLNIHAVTMLPIKNQIPTPGETGADHILRIWAE